MLYRRYVEDQRINIVDLLLEFLLTGEGMNLGELAAMIPSGWLPERYYSVTSSPLDDHGHRGDGSHDGVGQGGREEKKKSRILTVAFSMIDYLPLSLPLMS